MYYVAEILISLIMSVLQIGLIHMHIMLINRKPVRATDVFFCIKNHSDRFFGGAILYFVFSTIAQAPMIIARIFIGFSYEKIMTDIALIATSAILMIILSLTLPLYYYVLITDEQLSIFKCLTKAVSLMKGDVYKRQMQMLPVMPADLKNQISQNLALSELEIQGTEVQMQVR